ncbi:MAG: beta-L-arabinofuranosidase domain-containing protein [Anaerocolumna sp.]
MFKNFELDKVKLMDDYFSYRRELVKTYITEFDIDRLLHNFRKNAGIESNVLPLGGWEAEDCGLRGHFTGHFLSACSKFAFGDHDEHLKKKAYQIVDILECCAKPNGYLSAFEEEQLDILEVEEDEKIWAPYYTLHKILQGLLDCYIYLKSQKALKLSVNLGNYIWNRFQKLSDRKIDGILRCTKLNPKNEFGGIGDALYLLYDITQDDNMLQLAELFDRDYFINKLAVGKDILENLHANTHLPMVISAMHRYQITGNDMYKTGAVNFYNYLRGRTFVNGNNSSKAKAYIKGGVSEKSEHWGTFGDLSDALTGGESESCCAHNTEKIALQMFQWFGEAEYLDHIENLKYNAILNSASNKTGLSQYHQPMGTRVRKKFSGLYDTFWCCTASGMEAMSEIQKNIWFKSKDSILLNMFIKSEVLWEEKNLIISQDTRYPDSQSSVLTVEAQKPTGFKLILKAGNIQAIKINGEYQELVRHNGFITIDRVFNNNDSIELEINASLGLVPLKGCQDKVAVTYGKIVLAQIGEGRLTQGINVENLKEKLVKNSTGQLSFCYEEKGEAVTLIPLFRVEEEEYSVYFDLNKPASIAGDFKFAQDGKEAYHS